MLVCSKYCLTFLWIPAANTFALYLHSANFLSFCLFPCFLHAHSFLLSEIYSARFLSCVHEKGNSIFCRVHKMYILIVILLNFKLFLYAIVHRTMANVQPHFGFALSPAKFSPVGRFHFYEWNRVEKIPFEKCWSVFQLRVWNLELSRKLQFKGISWKSSFSSQFDWR